VQREAPPSLVTMTAVACSKQRGQVQHPGAPRCLRLQVIERVQDFAKRVPCETSPRGSMGASGHARRPQHAAIRAAGPGVGPPLARDAAGDPPAPGRADPQGMIAVADRIGDRAALLAAVVVDEGVVRAPGHHD